MNIKKYLERINFLKEISIDYDTLLALQKAHLFSVPFECLDVYYNKSIVLDKEVLYDKIVTQKRGGFCYELNGLFYYLLKELGFNVMRVSAQTYDEDKGFGKDFDHLSLLVTLGNRQYIVDVGFGAFALHPIEMVFGTIQNDPTGDFCLEKNEQNTIIIYKIVDENKKPEFKFKVIAQSFGAFEEMCHFHQTHPDSHFHNWRMISKATPEGRISMVNDVLKITHMGEVTKLKIEDENAFQNYLATYFNLHTTKYP